MPSFCKSSGKHFFRKLFIWVILTSFCWHPSLATAKKNKAASIYEPSLKRLTPDSLPKVEKKPSNWIYLIPPKYDDVNMNDIGYGYIYVKQGEHWGVYNLEGKELMRPDSRLGNKKIYARQGLIPIYKGKKFKSKCGYMDFNGSMVVPFMYDTCIPFNTGQYTWTRNKKAGQGGKDQFYVIDDTGKELLSLTGLEILNKDRIVYSADNGKKGIKRINGKQILPPEFTKIQTFYGDGLVGAYKNGKCGYYDINTGKQVLFSQYTSCGKFANGIAQVAAGGSREYFFINNRGDVLFNGLKTLDENSNKSPFSSGYQVISQTKELTLCGKKFTKNVFGVVDIRGNIVIPVKYNELANVSGQGFAAGSLPVEGTNMAGNCKPKLLKGYAAINGKFYKSSRDIPILFQTSAADWWKRLRIISGKKIDKQTKKKKGLSIFAVGEPEKVYVQPQFDDLKYGSSEFFKVRVGSKTGVIRVKANTTTPVPGTPVDEVAPRTSSAGSVSTGSLSTGSLDADCNVKKWKVTTGTGRTGQGEEGAFLMGAAQRGVHRIESVETFNLRGKKAYIKWQADSKNNYGSFWVGAAEQNIGNFTTKNSWNKSIFIQSHTWYYSTLEFRPDNKYISSTCTEDYCDNGGRSFYSTSGQMRKQSIDSVSNTGIFAGFNDVYVTNPVITIGEAKISCDSNNTILSVPGGSPLKIESVEKIKSKTVARGVDVVK